MSQNGLKEPFSQIIRESMVSYLETPKTPIFEQIWRFLSELRPVDIVSYLINSWNWFSGWFQDIFGLNTKLIFQAIGNVFIWLLGLIQELIRAGIDKL